MDKEKKVSQWLNSKLWGTIMKQKKIRIYMYPFYRYVCLTDTNMHFNLIWISVTGDYSNAK